MAGRSDSSAGTRGASAIGTPQTVNPDSNDPLLFAILNFMGYNDPELQSKIIEVPIPNTEEIEKITVGLQPIDRQKMRTKALILKNAIVEYVAENSGG